MKYKKTALWIFLAGRSLRALNPNPGQRRLRRKWPAPISRWQNTNATAPVSVTAGRPG